MAQNRGGAARGDGDMATGGWVKLGLRTGVLVILAVREGLEADQKKLTSVRDYIRMRYQSGALLAFSFRRKSKAAKINVFFCYGPFSHSLRLIL
jgi:hypothetical protein